jgi:hypothetical protein
MNNTRVRRLMVTAGIVPSSPILVTLMKEALRSSETWVLIIARLHSIPEDAILRFIKLINHFLNYVVMLMFC